MPRMIPCRLLLYELRILSSGDTFVADGILLTDSNCLISKIAMIFQRSIVFQEESNGFTTFLFFEEFDRLILL